MFTLMDTDNDGKVSYEELRAGLRKVGSQLAEPEIRMLMEVVRPFAFLQLNGKYSAFSSDYECSLTYSCPLPLLFMLLIYKTP